MISPDTRPKRVSSDRIPRKLHAKAFAVFGIAGRIDRNSVNPINVYYMFTRSVMRKMCHARTRARHVTILRLR